MNDIELVMDIETLEIFDIVSEEDTDNALSLSSSEDYVTEVSEEATVVNDNTFYELKLVQYSYQKKMLQGVP